MQNDRSDRHDPRFPSSSPAPLPSWLSSTYTLAPPTARFTAWDPVASTAERLHLLAILGPIRLVPSHWRLSMRADSWFYTGPVVPSSTITPPAMLIDRIGSIASSLRTCQERWNLSPIAAAIYAGAPSVLPPYAILTRTQVELWMMTQGWGVPRALPESGHALFMLAPGRPTWKVEPYGEHVLSGVYAVRAVARADLGVER
jgi:hypothetical protein